MDNAMFFPDTFEEFVKWYGFVDSGEHYTNGSELIQVFRVKQWLEHEANRQQTEIKEWKRVVETWLMQHEKDKAEIERLQTKSNEQEYDLELLKQEKRVVQAEAIKEFAEAVKMANTSKLTWFNENFDNLVKEMVGDAE